MARSPVDAGRIRPHPQLRRLAVHQDQKIGLAFVVLLLGFAGAFCFRTPPLTEARPLAEEEAAALDARIEQLPVRAYTGREGVDGETQGPQSSAPENVSAELRLADQVIRLGEPGAEQLRSEGDLVDLFPGPPEPLVVESPAEPLMMAGPAPETAEPESPEVQRVLPDNAGEGPEAPAVLPTVAQQSPPGPSVKKPQPPPASYLVKSGDTLSDIALRIYGDSRRYLDLYRANRDVLSDPHDLPVGTTLRIP